MNSTLGSQKKNQQPETISAFISHYGKHGYILNLQSSLGTHRTVTFPDVNVNTLAIILKEMTHKFRTSLYYAGLPLQQANALVQTAGGEIIAHR